MSKIDSLLDKFDNLPLECDGLTRVLHTVMVKEGYGHLVLMGTITLGEISFTPHFWIEITNNRIIDYRARMWLGPEAPHGIFDRDETQAKYEGRIINMAPLDDPVFSALTEGMKL